jgi:HEAT repeat protein
MHRSGWLLAAAGLLARAGLPLVPGAPPERSITTSSGSVAEVGGKTLDQWMRDLKSPDPSLRTHAILHIVQFGEGAVPAIPLLIDRCRDHDPSPRVKAVIALKVLPVPEKDVPRVVDALTQRLNEDGQQIVRYYAAEALVRYGEQARPAVAALARNATDRMGTYELRHMSIIALRGAALDPRNGPDPRATRALLAAMQDPVIQVRLEAIISLAALGRPADPRLLATVIRALQGLQSSRDKSISLWSHVALMAMDEKVTEKSLQAILRLLHSPESDIRKQVLLALEAIGPRAHSCVPDVLETLDDKDPAVVVAACAALGRLGDHSPKVTDALIAVTRRKEPALVYAACMALGEIGVTAPEVMNALAQVEQRKELDDLLLQQVKRIREQLRKPPAKKDGR